MTAVSTGKASAYGSARRPDDHVIVLFGATGDLAKRKLLPGLFHLAAAGLLPHKYKIIGSSPAKFAHQQRGVPRPRQASRAGLLHQQAG